MTNTAESKPVPPVVCTLTDGQLATRSLEWSDLSALSLGAERIDGGAASTYPLELTEQITDLVNRETDCCGSWLNSATSKVGDVFRLELTTTNPEGLGLIEVMSGLDA